MKIIQKSKYSYWKYRSFSALALLLCIKAGKGLKIKWGAIGRGGITGRRTLTRMMLAENAELVAVFNVLCVGESHTSKGG